MKKIISIAVLSIIAHVGYAQCDTTYVNTDLIISSDQIMSGVYIVDGDFEVEQGNTIYVQGYSFSDCGVFEVHANTIRINGNINGDYSGFPGGDGGAVSTQVNSLTGDITALTSCSNDGDPGHVQVAGGNSGNNGFGNGGGVPGSAGTTGSGPKQICETLDDTFGMFGSAGGAGGGGGGAYGADAEDGLTGGDGSDSYTSSGVDVSGSYPIVGGAAGAGGLGGSAYGTIDEWDIDLGSGGAGAGSGGRSYDQGLAGGQGGSGGGLVKLIAQDSLVVTGFISVNGEDGEQGGQGGSGGATSKCCSDGCDDCGEANFSIGAGAGGGAGGGSGGGIYLETKNAARIIGQLESKGGNGGQGGNKGSGISCNYSATFCGTQSITTADGFDGQAGGAGSGGRIKIFVPDCGAGIISPIYDVIGGDMNAAIEGTYAEVCGYLSTEESQELFTFQVYPNPANEYIKIRSFQNYTQGDIQLIDMAGRIVYEENNAQFDTPIYTHSLKKGLYLVKLNIGQNTAVVKISIQ